MGSKSQNDNSTEGKTLGTGLFTPIIKQKKEKSPHLAVRDAILSLNDTEGKTI
jgi:hypothetical protein